MAINVIIIIIIMSLTDPWKHALQWQKLTNFTNQTKIFKLNKTHIYNKIFQKVFLRSRGKSPPPPSPAS